MKSYSVSQVNSYLKNMFQSDYLLSSLCVEGEASNVKYHSSGHIYFTLKDAKSQMACVMFASARNRGLSFRMQDGQKLLVTGNIDVYERDGKYQLYAEKVRLSGAGDLYERFLRLKEALEDEGLFSPIYKKELPLYAKRVGIVTAQTGAAIRDIINISTRRNPYVELLLYPAKVQGEGAAQSIVKGLEQMEEEKPDVIIVGRGGGSMEDLWAFNEEIVARAIFACEIPVVSAVGHETDVTISDYVADLRAPTPSAAAELCVCNIRDLQYTIAEFGDAMTRAMEQKLSNARLILGNLEGRLRTRNPLNQLAVRKEQLLGIQKRLNAGMDARMQKEKHILALYMQRLKDLSPLNQLLRGYSYVTDDSGKNIHSLTQIEEKDTIHIAMHDGSLKAVVSEKIQKNSVETSQGRK